MDDAEQKKILATNIKTFRTAAGMSQQELGSRAGVGIMTISRCERGVYLPETATLLKLADVFGRPLDDFFNPRPPAPDPARQPALRFKLLRPVDAEMEREIQEFELRINHKYREQVFQAQERMRRRPTKKR